MSCSLTFVAQALRRRGKDTSLKIKYGSLRTVAPNPERRGFVEVGDVERQVGRPGRTLYGSSAGRAAAEWLSGPEPNRPCGGSGPSRCGTPGTARHSAGCNPLN